MFVIRKKLDPNELNPPGTRYNPTSHEVESTFDGGTTYGPNPAADPRHADAYRRPVVTGDDPRCLAAGNMTDALKAFVDAFLDNVEKVQKINAILAVVLVFLPALGLFEAIIFAIIEAFVFIGTAAIDEAFTEERYAQIMCAIYAHIGEDGQASAAQKDAIYDDVADLGDSVVTSVFGEWLNLIGEVGLSNAGTVGASERSCEDCVLTWCGWIDLRVGTDMVEISKGEWEEGLGIHQINDEVNAIYVTVVDYYPPDPESANITYVELWMVEVGHHGGAFDGIYGMPGQTPTLEEVPMETGNNAPSAHPDTIYEGFRFAFFYGGNNEPGGGWFRWIHLEGEGTRPEGLLDCPPDYEA